MSLDKEERAKQEFYRQTRRTDNQDPSGYSRFLNEHQHLIDKEEFKFPEYKTPDKESGNAIFVIVLGAWTCLVIFYWINGFDRNLRPDIISKPFSIFLQAGPFVILGLYLLGYILKNRKGASKTVKNLLFIPLAILIGFFAISISFALKNGYGLEEYLYMLRNFFN